MKKKFLLFLICVAIAVTSLIALVACKDEEEQGTLPEGNPAAFYNELVKASDVTISNYNIVGELINVRSLNEKGEFINHSDILTNNKLAKYDGTELWLYLDNDGDKIWTKAKIDKNNEIYKDSIAEIKKVIDLLSSVGTIKENQFEEIDGLWFVKGASNSLPKVGLKAVNDTLEGYMEADGKMYRDYVIELKSSIALPNSAEHAAAIGIDNLLGFADPITFLQTFFAADNVTAAIYELETPVIMGYNADGEFNDGETIAKYSGSDLWVYTTNDSNAWVKSNIKSDNQKYITKLQTIKVALRDLSEDIGDIEYTYDESDGFWYDSGYDIAIEVEDNTLSFWVYDEEIRDYSLYYELTLGSNLTLPEAAENATVVDEDQILGYKDPAEFLEEVCNSDNVSQLIYNFDLGSPDELGYIGSINSKGEFINLYNNYRGSTAAKYVNDELWIYENVDADAWIKAKIDNSNVRYKEIVKQFESNVKDRANAWLSTFTFIKEGDYWYGMLENGVIDREARLEIKGNDLYVYIELNGVYGNGYVYKLESNIILPESAENATVVDAGQIWGYDNPYDHINAMMDADNFSIRFNNGENWEYYALNTKGEFCANDIVGKFVDDEFWVYANDGRKALVEINGSNYKMVINAIRKVQSDKCTLPEGTTKDSFVKEEEHWNYGDFDLRLNSTTLDVYEKGVGWTTATMLLKTYIVIYADHDDYATVSEEEIFEF